MSRLLSIIILLVFASILGIVLAIWMLNLIGQRGSNSQDSSQIDSARADYLSKEGTSSRGEKFLQLVMQLEDKPAGHLNVLDVLGAPDLVRNQDTDIEWLYFFNRFGNKDWFVIVAFSKDDPSAEFAYNATSTLNRSDWTNYVPDQEDSDGHRN
jgi:hypothetical protein